MNSLEAFELAHARLLETQRKGLVARGLLYCLCGRLFPEGHIQRFLGWTVHYASNRCGKGLAEQENGNTECRNTGEDKAG